MGHNIEKKFFLINNLLIKNWALSFRAQKKWTKPYLIEKRLLRLVQWKYAKYIKLFAEKTDRKIYRVLKEYQLIFTSSFNIRKDFSSEIKKRGNLFNHGRNFLCQRNLKGIITQNIEKLLLH